jgi:hypothetical protein
MGTLKREIARWFSAKAALCPTPIFRHCGAPRHQGGSVVLETFRGTTLELRANLKAWLENVTPADGDTLVCIHKGSIDSRRDLSGLVTRRTPAEEIRALVKDFAFELTVLVGRTALEAVTEATHRCDENCIHPPVRVPGSGPCTVKTDSGDVALKAGDKIEIKDGKIAIKRSVDERGRPVRRPARPIKIAPRAKGEKRDPADIVALVEKLARYIATNPGQRIEQINKSLGVPTSELTLPIKKLLAKKRIKTRGHKRATTYWPKG